MAGDSERGGRLVESSSARLWCLISTDEIERRIDEVPLLAALDSKNAIFFSPGDTIGEMLPTLEVSVI
jgi:hypothetical protein